MPLTQELTQATTGDAIVDQGLAGAAAGAWPVKVTDGTNTAAVKAASTAPIATDPAVVVTISPNGNTVVSGQISSATATLTQVASANANTVILASNTSRKGFQITNFSTQICYVAFGTTASATVWNIRLPPQSYYESPPGMIYTGAINGFWVAANGFMQVNEMT